MKREDRDKVRWILDAFMAEHRAACPHFDSLNKGKCPTEAEYAKAQELVEAG